MHNQTCLNGSLAKRLLRQAGLRSLMLMTVLGSSVALAETGRIPTDQDTYPAPIKAIPAVLSQCFACHGPNGRSEYNDWPSLAGQKQSYLLQQLMEFKSGARNHPMMQPVVDVLSDDDLKTAADYLSVQPPPLPHIEPGTTMTRPAAAAVCIACHDNAALPTEPYLNAQQADYLAAQLRAFKTGARQDAVMQAMTQNLSEQDITDLALYFSAQPPIATGAK